MKANTPMADRFARNLGLIGFPIDEGDREGGDGSTDCGNVSQALPTIHPYIKVAPPGVPNHSRAFTEAARSPLARTGMLAAAKALAMTAFDLLADPAALAAAREDFTRRGDTR